MFSKIKEKFFNSYFVSNYKKMYVYIKPYKWRAFLAVLITIPVSSMDALIALALKPYMDIVMVEKNVKAAPYIPVLIIIFSLAQGILSYLSVYLNGWVGAKITNDLKFTLFSKLMHYDAQFFDKTSSGTVQMRFHNDVESACNGLLNHLKLFSTRVFSALSLAGVLLYNSWKLAIIALAILFCALFPLTKIRKKIKNIVSESVFAGSQIISYFIESFHGNRVITSYNLYEYQKKRFENTLRNVFSLGIKMIQKVGILSPIMHIIISIGIAVMIWLGSYMIINGSLTPGGFVSFITALLLLYQPIKAIGNDFNSLQMSLIAMERVFSLLEDKFKIVNKKNPKKLEKITAFIEYKNVNFSYDSSRQILKDINLKIKVGETIALVGNSGGGKTTFVNLLPRFYDVSEGSISIDGMDIRDIDLYSLRDKIAIVFQDNFLFSGTIRENIELGTQADKEKLDLAIESACLTEFISTLKLGLDTEIGERGVNLSGGQRQRVAIARAFLKNAPLVILDEATSALDNKSEKIVQRAIDNLMKDRTVIVIAHRLSTVKNADKIIVIDHGRIAEIGTHDILINKENGVYRSLYNTLN